MTKPVDILILSNGPGEVTTWVRPVVKALRQALGDDRSHIRISVVLSPCPNASGKEAAIALNYPEVDRVQAAEHFWQFLLWGKTEENWDWRDRGVVVFLGGDQIFPVVIGKKLGYRTVVYAEWDARWHNLIDRFGVMQAKVFEKVSPKYAHKFTVVGDLMVEAQTISTHNAPFNTEIIGLLPGSKVAKLSQGVPLCLAVAEYIHTKRPQTKFVIPVAPTLDLPTLASFADPEKNPFVKVFGSSSAFLVESDNPILKTETGLCVELCRENPAYELLSHCSICLTTVGANTAELGALAVPMIVVIPTQQLDAMRSWDGLPGLLANLPVVGSSFAKAINWLVLSRKGLLAWPNIWAKAEIVPELVGKLQPQDVGKMLLDFLDHPQKLDDMRNKLRSVRGESGAARKLAMIVKEEVLGFGD
ncbi:lipid-A-disaccharide synthase [Nostocales cyanobacterium LEGE 11386]|nr:lipid-A-disaccharide synthase [Nostocales cyanobacterium LEGE 11386]